MPICYQDEKRLLDYLVQRLEDRLAGRHETEILRTQPSDHCQLGVLSPWTHEPELEEQPDEILVDEARADRPDPVRPLRPAAVQAAPNEADPELPPPVEPFAVREDAARRPPSALGLAVAISPDAGEISLRITGRCIVYSRHFPDYAAQRLELGNRSTEVIAPGERPHVSLVEKFRRHIVELPEVTISLTPGIAASVDDSGALQTVFNQLAAQLRADPTTLRRFEGNRVVPVAALQNDETFQRFLQTWRGPAEVPDLRVGLRIRAQPSESGLRIEMHKNGQAGQCHHHQNYRRQLNAPMCAARLRAHSAQRRFRRHCPASKGASWASCPRREIRCVRIHSLCKPRR